MDGEDIARERERKKQRGRQPNWKGRSILKTDLLVRSDAGLAGIAKDNRKSWAKGTREYSVLGLLLLRLLLLLLLLLLFLLYARLSIKPSTAPLSRERFDGPSAADAADVLRRSADRTHKPFDTRRAISAGLATVVVVAARSWRHHNNTIAPSKFGTPVVPSLCRSIRIAYCRVVSVPASYVRRRLRFLVNMIIIRKRMAEIGKTPKGHKLEHIGRVRIDISREITTVRFFLYERFGRDTTEKARFLSVAFIIRA